MGVCGDCEALGRVGSPTLGPVTLALAQSLSLYIYIYIYMYCIYIYIYMFYSPFVISVWVLITGGRSGSGVQWMGVVLYNKLVYVII